MGIIACIGLIFLVFGALLFVILYFPLKKANEGWMKDIFQERNEKAEKVMENIGEEMLVIDAEFEEQEKKKNPDWKRI